MERLFALYTSDSFYATRFMEYFKKKKESDFEISAFTRKDSLEEFLTENSVEILLYGDQGSTEELSYDNVKYIYKLTDNPTEKNSMGFPAVYKYQPAQSVMNKIISDYKKRENIVMTVNTLTQVKLISVFSPLRNAETIAFTWSLGSLLSEQEKVLLVMLDPLPIQLVSFADDANTSLSEFIYYLKEKSGIAKKLKELLLFSGNLSYLSGISNAADILSLTKEDIKNWVDDIKTHTDFQTVVFYLGDYNDAMSELMKLSDSVFVTSTNLAYENTLYTIWTQQMMRSGLRINKDKFTKVGLLKEELGQVPLSLTELKNTAAWGSAQEVQKMTI